jgi:hypothetical protein
MRFTKLLSTLLVAIAMLSMTALAQETHTIGFESAEDGTGWVWTVSENGDNPALEFIANPNQTGANTTANVAKFTARSAANGGNPWALFFTDGDGEFTFDDDNKIVKIMVHKDNISPVHFKVEGAGGTPLELTTSNTVTGAWEELTFDFSAVVGQTFNRLVIIPDFVGEARPADNVVYLDNIQVPDGVIATGAETHTIGFESAEDGTGWEWVVTENADNPPLEFIANPDQSGANTTANVAKFTARENGNPWALFETTDDGEFTFTADNSVVKIMVWKPTTSNVRVEFLLGAAIVNRVVANTTTNAWEELTFDFSEFIGQTFNKVVVFPDFTDGPRGQENIIYIDNIQMPDGEVMAVEVPEVAAPAPDLDAGAVISLFSDAYDDVLVDTWSAPWDNTDYAEVEIEGNATKQYSNFVYAGIEFTTEPIDATDMTHIHLHVWTPDLIGVTPFKVKLVDAGADGDILTTGDNDEGEVLLNYESIPAMAQSEWASLLIPLENMVTPLTQETFTQTAHLAQLILADGLTTVYVDNVLFFNANYTSIGDETGIARSFKLQQNYPNPFNPTTTIDFSLAVAGKVEIAVFNALGQKVATVLNTAKAAGDHSVVFDAAELPSGAYFYRLTAGSQTTVRKMMLIK